MKEKIQVLEQKAINDNIPIMSKDAIKYISKLIDTYKIEDILEIGTAVGYSAINFALVSDEVRIVSIERDQKRFIEAIKNVKDFNLSDRVELVYNDALNLEINDKFDMIIIDAAKGKNIEFFEKFKHNLKKGGIIITDNTLFHGLVGKSDEIPSKNLRSLVKKIETYIDFLKENTEFKTIFLNIGDGLAVSKMRD